MNAGWYNQFREEVDRRRDYEGACWQAQQDAIRKGHSAACKWVTVLEHQPAADESWCDCKKRKTK